MFWLPIPCCCCGCVGVEPRKRLNTAYLNDECNWQAYACPLCSMEIDDYWTERWQEYYRGLL